MSGRKVHADFDKTRGYSVDVSDCTLEMKKEVQQAFFDVGIAWRYKLQGVTYLHLDAGMYTNVYDSGVVTKDLKMSYGAYNCNMTAKEFLNLVYEDDMVDNKGHVHAELMAQYAEDAKTHAEPWKLWQVKGKNAVWHNLYDHPMWLHDIEYRRKPKTHIVNGIYIPDLRVSPKYGEYYYLADPTEIDFTYSYLFHGDEQDKFWVDRGLCYQHTKEGKQAAILHAKAMLGIA